MVNGHAINAAAINAAASSGIAMAPEVGYQIYTLTLGGGSADLSIPMASFSIRMSEDVVAATTTNPTYASAVIPDPATYSSEIAARIGESMTIALSTYSTSGELISSDDWAAVTITRFDTDYGPNSSSGTLHGSSAPLYANAASITLSGVSYRAVRNGKRQVRSMPDADLRPNDTATDAVGSFTVGSISIYVNPTRQQMDIVEKST